MAIQADAGAPSGSCPAAAPAVYSLAARAYRSEDILFCVDLDVETKVPMRVPGRDGRPVTRLEAIKQGLLFFVNTKLSINPDHRFSFCSLATTINWVCCSLSLPLSLTFYFAIIQDFRDFVRWMTLWVCVDL